MDALSILAGFLLLVAGRKLYWFFSGVVGFLVGMYLATRFINADPAWLTWVIAILLGLVGAGLAIFLQNAALAVVSFLAGAYGGVYLIKLLGIQSDVLYWVFLVIGGIVGVVLMGVVFQWALIILSAGIGAALLNQGFGIQGGQEALAFIVLLIFGITVQALAMMRERRRVRARPKAVPEAEAEETKAE